MIEALRGQDSFATASDEELGLWATAMNDRWNPEGWLILEDYLEGQESYDAMKGSNLMRLAMTRFQLYEIYSGRGDDAEAYSYAVVAAIDYIGASDYLGDSLAETGTKILTTVALEYLGGKLAEPAGKLAGQLWKKYGAPAMDAAGKKLKKVFDAVAPRPMTLATTPDGQLVLMAIDDAPTPNMTAMTGGGGGGGGGLKINVGGEGEAAGFQDVNPLQGNRRSEAAIVNRNPTGNPSGSVTNGSIDALPFADESVAILESNKLPSVVLGRSGQKAIDEVQRVLQSGGTARISSQTAVFAEGSDLRALYEAAGFNFPSPYEAMYVKP